ncbi:MAG: hypothetical protein WAN36_08785, partial [Calditrichia bacterium]
MKKYLLFTLIILFCISFSLFAQGGFIPVTVDYATFRSENEDAYIEVYISLYQNSLKYLPEGDKLRSHYTVTLKVLQNDSVLFQKNKQLQNFVETF